MRLSPAFPSPPPCESRAGWVGVASESVVRFSCRGRHTQRHTPASSVRRSKKRSYNLEYRLIPAAAPAQPSDPPSSALPFCRSAAVPPLPRRLAPSCRYRAALAPRRRPPLSRSARRPMSSLPSYRAAPPLHTHLNFCSTGFALRSEPSRRCVPQRPRWARRTGPRVLRSNLAEPERRLARWMLA